MNMKQLTLLLLSVAMLGGLATGCAKSDEDAAKAVEDTQGHARGRGIN